MSDLPLLSAMSREQLCEIGLVAAGWSDAAIIARRRLSRSAWRNRLWRIYQLWGISGAFERGQDPRTMLVMAYWRATGKFQEGDLCNCPHTHANGPAA